jgi:hypothetical protein
VDCSFERRPRCDYYLASFGGRRVFAKVFNYCRTGDAISAGDKGNLGHVFLPTREVIVTDLSSE